MRALNGRIHKQCLLIWVSNCFIFYSHLLLTSRDRQPLINVLSKDSQKALGGKIALFFSLKTDHLGKKCLFETLKRQKIKLKYKILIFSFKEAHYNFRFNEDKIKNLILNGIKNSLSKGHEPFMLLCQSFFWNAILIDFTF